ncbi:type IV pilus assembly protein FimV [Halopseudomonas pelagia]|uniref:type IV pilus assembly protein FimV n=1 Tax=Halopseudomonas pelagia TaxID=553151 RepID=UPI0003A38972|nr:FimV/HubP family polar landmark protein [Halopseudomonas pelagia]
MAVKRQVIAGVATLAALYVGVSNALGLGELRLDSALNQPLSAIIQLQGGEGLAPTDIRVSLANQEAFQSAGIDRPFFLTDLRFVPVVENNQLFIRVESSRPVREPYLNFLVELRRPNGRMLREYTLLLDPPLYDPQAGVLADAPRQAPASSPQRPVVAAAQPRSSYQADPQPDLPQLTPAPGADQYTTVSGDTLWDIAAAQRPDSSVNIRTNMLAIRALNPQAFVDGNINRLRANQALTLPTREQLVSAGAPASILDAVAAAQPDTVAESQEQPVIDSAAQTPAQPEVQAPSPSRPQQESAELVDPEMVSEASPQDASDARLRIEESSVETAEADSVELLDRLRSLESRFNVLLSELDARDAQIASLQAELEVLRQARDAEMVDDDALVGVTGAGSLGSSEQGSGPGSAEGSDSPAPGSLNASVLPAEESVQAAPSRSSWVAWLTLPLVLVAFLLGLFLARRRSSDDADDDRPESVEPEAPAGFSSNITTVPAMVARPVQQVVKPPVDPLDGVELYITYGRFAEARIMLDKAIDEEPERLDLRYKQLRVLAELGDAPAFAEQIEEIGDLGGDPERVNQIKARFPLLFDANGDMVEQAEQLDPMIDEDLEIKGPSEFRSGIVEEHDESSTSQLNLNDFTLDPDWDLIEGLSPEPVRRSAEREAAREKAQSLAKDDDFESSLHDFPEVEELDEDHHDHFTPTDGTRPGGGKKR